MGTGILSIAKLKRSITLIKSTALNTHTHRLTLDFSFVWRWHVFSNKEIFTKQKALGSRPSGEILSFMFKVWFVFWMGFYSEKRMFLSLLCHSECFFAVYICRGLHQHMLNNFQFNTSFIKTQNWVDLYICTFILNPYFFFLWSTDLSLPVAWQSIFSPSIFLYRHFISSLLSILEVLSHLVPVCMKVKILCCKVVYI